MVAMGGEGGGGWCGWRCVVRVEVRGDGGGGW